MIPVCDGFYMGHIPVPALVCNDRRPFLFPLHLAEQTGTAEKQNDCENPGYDRRGMVSVDQEMNAEKQKDYTNQNCSPGKYSHDTTPSVCFLLYWLFEICTGKEIRVKIRSSLIENIKLLFLYSYYVA